MWPSTNRCSSAKVTKWSQMTFLSVFQMGSTPQPEPLWMTWWHKMTQFAAWLVRWASALRVGLPHADLSEGPSQHGTAESDIDDSGSLKVSKGINKVVFPPKCKGAAAWLGGHMENYGGSRAGFVPCAFTVLEPPWLAQQHPRGVPRLRILSRAFARRTRLRWSLPVDLHCWFCFMFGYGLSLGLTVLNILYVWICGIHLLLGFEGVEYMLNTS